jgi:broad specificity phosphatase PhoE
MPMRQLLAATFLALFTAGAADAQSVFLVRHAERADAGAAPAMMASDPDLSPTGTARAESLAAMLKDANVRTIVTTEYKRTKQTAAPLARTLGIEPAVIASQDTAGLAARLKAATGNVLVVGHSNTLPEIIKLLGIDEPVTIAEAAFDDLFIVSRVGAPALLRLHYK